MYIATVPSPPRRVVISRPAGSSSARIAAAIEHKRAAGMNVADSVADYLRDAAFTAFNRFVALKMLEARELVVQGLTVLQSSQGVRWEIRDTAAYFWGRTDVADGVCNIAIDAVAARFPLVRLRTYSCRRMHPRIPDTKSVPKAWERREA